MNALKMMIAASIFWMTNNTGELLYVQNGVTNSCVIDTYNPLFGDSIVDKLNLDLRIEQFEVTNVRNRVEVPIYFKDAKGRAFATNYVDLTYIYEAVEGLRRRLW